MLHPGVLRLCRAPVGKIRDLFVRPIMRFRQTELHRQEMVRFEAGIDLQNGEQALDHKAGTEEQDTGERNLRHDERLPSARG